MGKGHRKKVRYSSTRGVHLKERRPFKKKIQNKKKRTLGNTENEGGGDRVFRQMNERLFREEKLERLWRENQLRAEMSRARKKGGNGGGGGEKKSKAKRGAQVDPRKVL